MLRSLRGLWRWYGKAEGDDPPPAFSLWHLPVAFSINLSRPVLQPAVLSRFCFAVQAGQTEEQRGHSKPGSHWQSFIS
jgi:hypothetical protein